MFETGPAVSGMNALSTPKAEKKAHQLKMAENHIAYMPQAV